MATIVSHVELGSVDKKNTTERKRVLDNSSQLSDLDNSNKQCENDLNSDNNPTVLFSINSKNSNSSKEKKLSSEKTSQTFETPSKTSMSLEPGKQSSRLFTTHSPHIDLTRKYPSGISLKPSLEKPSTAYGHLCLTAEENLEKPKEIGLGQTYTLSLEKYNFFIPNTKIYDLGKIFGQVADEIAEHSRHIRDSKHSKYFSHKYYNRLIFKETENSTRVVAQNLLPEDWEDYLFELLEDTSIKSLELSNMSVYEHSAFFDHENRHRDILKFIQRLQQIGIQELNLGNTALYASLPSWKKMRKLQNSSNCVNTETWSLSCAAAWLFCCPCMTCALPFCNPNTGSYLDECDPNDPVFEADQKFLMELALSLAKFSSVSFDMESVLYTMARMKAQNIKKDGIKIDVPGFTKALTSFKSQKLVIRNLLTYVLSSKTVNDILDTILSNQELRVFGLTPYVQNITAGEILSVAEKISRSHIEVLVGLCANSLINTGVIFKKFIQFLMQSAPHLQVIDLSDLSSYSEHQKDTYRKEKGLIEIIVGNRKLTVIGLNTLYLEMLLAFIEAWLEVSENNTTLDLSDIEIFSTNTPFPSKFPKGTWVYGVPGGQAYDSYQTLAKLITQHKVINLILFKKNHTVQEVCINDFVEKFAVFANALANNNLLRTFNDFDDLHFFTKFFRLDKLEAQKAEEYLLLQMQLEQQLVKNRIEFVDNALKQEVSELHACAPVRSLLMQYFGYQRASDHQNVLPTGEANLPSPSSRTSSNQAESVSVFPRQAI